MYIDVEEIVREEIRALLKEHLQLGESKPIQESITTVERTNKIEDTNQTTLPYPVKRTSAKAPEGVTWEYAAEKSKRRSPEHIKMHEKEIELGRNLTPEEKGEIEAGVELDDEAREKSKEDAKKKAHINKLTSEAEEKAKLETEAENKSEPETGGKVFVNGEEVNPEELEKTPNQAEATRILEEQKKIPKTDDLNDINKMFQ